MAVGRAVFGLCFALIPCAPALAQTVCTLSAQLAPTEDPGPTALLPILARIDCTAGTVAENLDPYAEGLLDRLEFTATPGERVIIGASLTDEAPSAWDPPAEVKPDLDFPIRFVTIPDQGGSVEWRFTTPNAQALTYGHLIMRVWNPSALAECATGRDGCDKFGYVLLWDERRAEGALELPMDLP